MKGTSKSATTSTSNGTGKVLMSKTVEGFSSSNFTKSGGQNVQTQVLKYSKSSKSINGSKTQSRVSSSEKQGPIDWSVNGLKSKYRGEEEREEAWRKSIELEKQAELMLQSKGIVLPVSKVNRHPFYVMYYKHLYNENFVALSRTKSRLLMKRFVFDVQELWLTNLQHLREHQSALMFTGEENDENLKEKSTNFLRGNGLKDRRDVQAIKEMDSQIQSVSQQRIFQNAYHTSRMPDVKVALDYQPFPTTTIKDIKPRLPVIQTLIENISLSLEPHSLSYHNKNNRKRYVFTSPHSPLYKFEGTSVILHIDRLIPSTDYQMIIQPEVIWRFTIYYGGIYSLKSKYYLCKESSIATYITDLLQEGEKKRPSYLLYSIPLILFDYSDDPHKISYERSVSIGTNYVHVDQISVAIGAFGQQQLLNNNESLNNGNINNIETISPFVTAIKIEISARIVADDMGDVENGHIVYLECSPVEITHLVKTCTLMKSPHLGEPVLAYNISVHDVLWWVDPKRNDDLWPFIIPFLIIQRHINNADNYANNNDVTISLALQYDQSLLFMQQEGPTGVTADHSSLISDESSINTNIEISTRGNPKNRYYKSDANKVLERAEGALPTSSALSCAYELLEFLSVVSTPNNVNDDNNNNNNNNNDDESTIDHNISLRLEYTHVDFFFNSTENNLNPSFLDGVMNNISPENNKLVVHNELMNELRLKNGLKNVMPLIDDTIPIMNNDNLTTNGVHPTMFQPITQREIYCIYTGQWEYIMNHFSYNSSLLASLNHKSGLDLVTVVPGICETGQQGLWYPDHNTGIKTENNHYLLEYTQASARYFRDSKLSSTDTVLVNMTYALDTAILLPTIVAWEYFSTFPTIALAEEIDDNCQEISIPILTNAIPNALIYSEPLDSPLEKRMSDTIIIFQSTPREGIDYMPVDLAHTTRKPKGYCRHFPTKNMNGFRQQIEVKLLGVDPVLPTMVFGITSAGAQPNNMNVNVRNIWHNTLAVTEHINRPRVAKDYHYILAKQDTQGANQPTSYTTRMKAGEFVGLTSSAFPTYEEAYLKIKQQREVFARQLALDAKLEQLQLDMKMKELQHKQHITKSLQYALEKKLRKATKSELGWKRRFKASTLIEIQGNWERRRDEISGVFFFRKLSNPNATLDSNDYLMSNNNNNNNNVVAKEKFNETCQWQVPGEWDGDPLAQVNNNGDEQADPYGQNIQRILSAGQVVPPKTGWTRGRKNKEDDNNNNSIMSRYTKEVSDVGIDEEYLDEETLPPIGTNLEHIAEQLVSSDELMRVIAKRLGIPEAQIIPADELSSVFSVNSLFIKNKTRFSNFDNNDKALDAPRDNWIDDIHETEFDSDDDLWSENNDVEQGDFDAQVHIGSDELLPENHAEQLKLKRQQYIDIHGDVSSNNKSVPSQIPYLQLSTVLKNNSNGMMGNGNDITQNPGELQDLFGWRRLPRPMISQNFMSNSLKTHTAGPDKVTSNTMNAPVFLLPMSPVDACKYYPPEFHIEIESIFIPDAKKDMERAIATIERNIRREEELSRNLPTDDLLLFGEAKEFTSADAFMARQLKEDQEAVADPKELAMEKAVLAAKSNNIAMMEDALAEDIPINTTDRFGNTLLILAAQQGSKRMCKFLLRRGANINMQSLSGNTALHYCYAYSQLELAEYLKSKGADDSILNVDGVTCYEGLSMDDLKDEDEDEYVDADEDGNYIAKEEEEDDYDDDYL
eukprot:gene7229-9860_t